MVQTRTATIIGVFKDQPHALQAVNELRAAGFTDSQIGLVTRNWVQDGPTPAGVKVQETAGDGALTGAVSGAGLGALAGVLGASLIPGIGVVIAGGLLVSAVAGAAFGAAAGTFVGPFIAMGMSEDEAQRRARDVQEGRTVVMVHTEQHQEDAQEILTKHGAYDDSMQTLA